MGRIMIAGTSSGCGKTSVVCALLQAFKNAGEKLYSFKCGPDFIDPMFHRSVLGIPSGNLDGFLMDSGTIRYQLDQKSKGRDMTMLEGVMGYYDGIGMQDTASSFSIAKITETPVILVINCRGMSRSAEAQLLGYLRYRQDSGIRGVIFNRLPGSLYPELEKFCRENGIVPLGYLPDTDAVHLGSRHLGLITAEELSDLSEKLQLLGEIAEQYIDLNAVRRLSEEAPELGEPVPASLQSVLNRAGSGARIRIAVARDRAFSFYYQENLELLEQLGCETVPFSPLNDRTLPEAADGILLGGGYPELYGSELEENRSMRESILKSIRTGIPVYGECGGFLYLHDSLSGPDGTSCRMTGALPGKGTFTGKLQHFGYSTMTAARDNLLCLAGEKLRVHEFHRCLSEIPQTVFESEKNGKRWGSFVSSGRILAGFPHLHFYNQPETAARLVDACRRYRKERAIT